MAGSPDRGLSVFVVFYADAIVDPPRWFAVALLALGALFAWGFDREEAEQASAPAGPEPARQ